MTNRVHYREQQVLRAEDLRDEQRGRIALRRLHQLGHHDWGIVRGLDLDLSPDRRQVRISPGMAVDGFGRELPVDQALAFSAATFGAGKDQEEDVFDLYLCYRLIEPGPECDCRPPEEVGGSDSVASETVWVKVLYSTRQNQVNSDRPPGVSAAQAGMPPHERAAQSEAEEWPVYLGRVGLSGEAFTLEPVARRSIDVIAAQVSHPAHRDQPWLVIGNEEATDNRRFAIRLPDASGNFTQRLSLDRQGNAAIVGSLHCYPAGAGAAADNRLPDDGNIVLAPRAEGPFPSLHFSQTSAPPQTGQPWTSYRTRSGSREQLRFEIFHPGEQGDPLQSQWAVGSLVNEADASLRFSPGLVCRADGTVMINGILELKGQLIQGPIPADLDSDRFRNELLSRWTKGLTSASSEVDAFYKLAITIKTTTESTPPLAQITFRVTLTNNNVIGGDGSLGSDFNIYIASMRLQLSDPTGELVRDQVIYVRPANSTGDNPIPPSGTLDVKSSFQNLLPNTIYTLVVTARLIGSSSNVTLDRSASRVISVPANE